MSQYSYHLEPALPGVEIRDFRVTGLPDPIVGSDAVPLRWLNGGGGGGGGGSARVLDVNLNLQTDSEGSYAIVDHNLQTLSVEVALWRFVNSAWSRIYSQVTAQSTNRALIRFSRTNGTFPVRAVFVAGPITL